MFMSKQYRHQRALAKEGKRAQFGSYTYTATDFNEKGESSHAPADWSTFAERATDPLPGVLLKIHDFSPRQYDKVQISISSNEVGVFEIEMLSPEMALAAEQIRMEDLLQAQFDNEQNLVLFDGTAAFSINMLIHQINKSESPNRATGFHLTCSWECL